MDATSAKRSLLLAAIASLCFTAAIAIVALLVGELDDTSGRILATTALISGYSFLALPAGVLYDRGEARPLALAIVGLAVAAFLLWMGELWLVEDLFEEGDDESWWKAIGVTTVFGVACAETGLVVARSRAGDAPAVENLGRAAIVLGFIVAALVSAAILDETESDAMFRLVGVLAVLNVLALALRPLVRRMEGTAGGAPAAAPAPQGAHHFTCTLDRPARAGAANGLPGRLAEDGLTVECELDGATFAAAVGGAVALVEDASGARVVRIERTS